MKTKYFSFRLLWVVCALSLTAPTMALSKFDKNYNAVDIEIITDAGGSLPLYPVTNRYIKNEYRAYLEAINGSNYALRIRNHTNQRLGLVIAVDGRNIISGKKSDLKHHESMYILAPYQTQTYTGWRTSTRDIHRFYFTDSQDSYAYAFGDDSAMGVIAVAVFEENKPKLKIYQEEKSEKSKAPAGRTRSYEANDSIADADVAEREAGTGFGEHETSLAYRVHFNPKRTAKTKFFYKYEWRETLCQKRIIDCNYRKNRFWPYDDYEVGFAPYPLNNR